MLIKVDDLTIADYSKLEAVIPSEVKSADVVTILGKHPGGIYCPKKARWKAEISNFDHPFDLIRSKKEKKQIPINLEFLAKNKYQLKTLPLDLNLYQQFLDLYKNTTLKKKRVLKFDLETNLKLPILAGKKVFLSGVFQGKQLISAITFYVNADEVTVRYGAKEKIAKLRGGFGGLIEYELIRFCLTNKIKRIDHGSNTNPAGLVGGAGVFEFKARYGYTAYPEGEWQTVFIQKPETMLSDVVFVTILDNQIGYLILTKEQKEQQGISKKYSAKGVKLIKLESLYENNCRFDLEK